MISGRICIVVPLLCLVTLASTKPIMVTFGTNQGPIIPRQPKTSSTQHKTVVTRSPAPVSEEREDVPNPNAYKAPVPHQYRTELYSFKPPADLALGTALDQKYTPSIDKINQQRKQFVRNILGVDYRGPHTFEKQDYEILEAKKNRLAWKYNKPHYYQEIEKRVDEQTALPQNNDSKYVPQIGVVYSAGVRYYVPQLVYYDQPVAGDNPDLENSVYDERDTKYQH
ncbi:uncharacterized protein LOC108903370 [Anoplophora glabripennis]|uniref:uncharacterized protein LOC108903370 n=1 Tax=Anoplophora glabripennis TaxID=217634 RepID=UPI000874D44D|nr:uncharacterized protein LOC108903370 [Anoplophora glabripennis]